MTLLNDGRESSYNLREMDLWSSTMWLEQSTHFTETFHINTKGGEDLFYAPRVLLILPKLTNWFLVRNALEIKFIRKTISLLEATGE